MTVTTEDLDGDYSTGAYIAVAIVQDEAEAEHLLAAHSHAKARPSRRPRWLRLPRKAASAPAAPAELPLTASRLLDMADISEPGEFTREVNRWQSPVTGEGVLERPAPAPEAAPEDADPEPTQAIAPAELPDDLITDAPPTPRPFAPPVMSCTPPPVADSPWGPWDERPGRPEPMQRYIPDLIPDLTELPFFRATLAASAAIARRSLFGCQVGEDTWGGRVVSAGIGLYSVPEAARAAFSGVVWTGPGVREDTIRLRAVAA